MLRMKCFALALGCGALLCATRGEAGAQTGIYGEFTAGKISAPNTAWMYGPTVGLYHDDGLGLVAVGLGRPGIVFAARRHDRRGEQSIPQHIDGRRTRGGDAACAADQAVCGGAGRGMDR